MYFDTCLTLDDIKKTYRQLALKNHPAVGGSLEIMQSINAEHDLRFAQLTQLHGQTSKTTASQTRYEFYAEQGWTGTNYSLKLSMAEITKLIRIYCKNHFPDCKFSVSRRDYNVITVALLEAPFESITNDMSEITKKYRHCQHALRFGTTESLEVMRDIELYANSYNYDYSNSQFDYFDKHFYLHLEIGKYDKPFQVNTSRAKRSRTRQVKTL